MELFVIDGLPEKTRINQPFRLHKCSRLSIANQNETFIPFLIEVKMLEEGHDYDNGLGIFNGLGAYLTQNKFILARFEEKEGGGGYLPISFLLLKRDDQVNIFQISRVVHYCFFSGPCSQSFTS